MKVVPVHFHPLSVFFGVYSTKRYGGKGCTQSGKGIEHSS